MNRFHLLALAGLTALAPIASHAAPPHVPQAEIPFANHGGVSDWRADGDKTIYFQDQHRKWYKATLFAPAFDLPFVETIGIDAGPTGSLDNFGAVIIKGQRYAFDSFVAVDGPPADRKGKENGKEKGTDRPHKIG